MQGATLSHPRYYPHMLAPALNIPHNKAKGSDKSYYFQPSHLKARDEATLFLDILRGKQTSSPKKLPKAEHMPNMARQAWEKIGIFICQGVYNREGEPLWAAKRYHNTLEGEGWMVPPTLPSRLAGNVQGVNAGLTCSSHSKETTTTWLLPIWHSYFSFSDCGIIESHISSKPMVSSSKCRRLMNSQLEFIKENRKKIAC